MKKLQLFVFGITFTLFGFVVATAISASAASPLIGKKIDSIMAVKFNGKKLSRDAIVIEGTSYLPVRVVAQEMGLNIEVKNKEILLSGKGGVAVSEATKEAQKQQAQWDLENINREIDSLKSFISGKREENRNLQQTIDQLKRDNENEEKNFETFNPDPSKYKSASDLPSYKYNVEVIEKYQRQIEENNQKIREAEAKLQELEQRKAQLEAQQ